MKTSFTLLPLIVVLAGCLPLRQYELVSGPSHPRVGLDEPNFASIDYLLVDIDMKREKILPAQSYILNPKGKRYTIQVQPHQFDIEQKFDVLRAQVNLYDVNGSRVRRWSNGIWSFHFVVETNGVTQAIDQQWKYWTFYYNPIIHGPPN